MATRCVATKADGTPCRGFAGKGSAYCINHDPARWEIAQAGRSLGRERQAEARATAPALTPEEAGEPPRTLDDLRRLVSETLIAVQTGRVDPRRGAVVVSLARTMGRLLPVDEKRPRTVAAELEVLPFADLARRAVASLATCLNLEAGPEAEALREELRAMLAPQTAAPTAELEAPGPGLSRVLQLLEQDRTAPGA